MKKKSEKSKKVDNIIVVALIGLIGTIITALLTSPVLIRLMERAPEAAVSPQSIAPIFSQDFEGGNTSGFGFESGDWVVSKDNSNNILKGTGTESFTPAAIAYFGPADFTNGVIEFRFKFVQAHGMILDFRLQDKGVYILYLHPEAQNIVLGINVDGNVTELGADAVQSFTFQEDIWYTVRLEVQGSQFTASVDGNQIMSTSDTRLDHGRLRFALEPNTIIYLDDVQVWSLDQ